jgi:hypothetical protein
MESADEQIERLKEEVALERLVEAAGIELQRRGKDLVVYQEYTVRTPGAANRGAQRVVVGKGGEYYYTPNHYQSFQRFDPSRRA